MPFSVLETCHCWRHTNFKFDNNNKKNAVRILLPCEATATQKLFLFKYSAAIQSLLSCYTTVTNLAELNIGPDIVDAS